MSDSMSLKAKIRNLAKQKNIPAQVILQNFMFERLLVRLSASTYKDEFVLKGGMLAAAIVGLNNRATMDLDTTLKNLPLTPNTIRSALEQVCAIQLDDGAAFEIGTISPAVPLSRSRMFPLSCITSKKAWNSKRCGISTASNLPMLQALNKARL